MGDPLDAALAHALDRSRRLSVSQGLVVIGVCPTCAESLARDAGDRGSVRCANNHRFDWPTIHRED